MSVKRRKTEGPQDEPVIDSVGGSLREMERKRRQVFRPVLDNPFTQTTQWPFIEPDLAENVLGLLIMALRGLGTYNEAVKREHIKNLPSQKGKRGPKDASGNVAATVSEKKTTSHLISPIIGKATVGFNSTMKVLENQAKTFHLKGAKDNGADPFYKYVFVCKYDITPLLLTYHFPMLSYTASKSKTDRVKLVQLPRGAMQRLSEALKVENAGIIAMSTIFEPGRALFELVDEKVSDVTVPWLEGILDGESAPFHKPNLAYLATSAPILQRNSKPSKASEKGSGKSCKKPQAGKSEGEKKSKEKTVR